MTTAHALSGLLVPEAQNLSDVVFDFLHEVAKRHPARFNGAVRGLRRRCGSACAGADRDNEALAMVLAVTAYGAGAK